jgi:hypothetical protein
MFPTREECYKGYKNSMQNIAKSNSEQAQLYWKEGQYKLAALYQKWACDFASKALAIK